MRWLFFGLLLTLAATASAQLPIPLDSAINLRITGRDTALLKAYNIYNFEYLHRGDTLSAAMLVLKADDDLNRKSYILAKLQRVTTLIFIPPNDKHKGLTMDVGDGIEISNKEAQNTKAYLNFNPDLPDPVFLLKEVVEGDMK
jgi:hypothetical protein